jgi:hypothetical protein
MRRVLLIVLLLGLSVSSAFAQATGQINGVVADNSGGVVPGVTVTAVEAGTGVSRETVTAANGRYSFVSLRPTTYEIRAELAGFRTVRQTDVVLAANQNLTLNITLELGELSETVTVAGEAASVDISSATIAEVVDSKRIVELPLNGRDAARLSMLVSGMVVTEVNQESGKTIPGALRLSTNGTESRQASFRLDGTNHTDSYFQQNQPFPFPDALQEFSIQTSNYSAAQGASAGAVVNAVTRSGTNNLHGGVFGYARDRTFNSKNFFLPERDFLKRKQYGGYAGGPILRNRLFFFTGWQGTTIQNVGGTLTQTIPTTAMRNGDFSAVPTQLRDPNGGIFPGNQIPVSRFDPAAVNVMKYMPNAAGGNGATLQIPRRIGQNDNQVIGKVDAQLNDNNQVSARYFFDHFTNDPTFEEGNLLTYRNPTLGSRQRIQNVVTSWQRTLTSTLLNEFRVGFNKFASSRYPPTGVPSMQDLGVRLPIYPTSPSISEIQAVGFFNIGDNLFASFPRHGVEINDRVNWAKGKHQVQFGGEMAFQDVKIRNEFRRASHSVFRPNATAGTGHALADFVLGQLDTFDQGTGEYKDYKVFYASAFFQDDFKASDRLTLNLGVRFEHSPPWHEVVGRIMHWSVTDYNANVRSTVFPQAPRGETFRGDANFVGEEGVEASPNTASARFGFAWDITGDGRTSLRGGGGTFYDQRRDGESGNGAVNAPPFSLRLNVARGNQLGPFSNPYLPRTDFNQITDATVGTTSAVFPRPVLISTFGDEYKVPITYNFNLTFEREILNGLMGRVAYVGTRNRNGRHGINLNYARFTPGDTRGTDARRIYAADGIGSIESQVQDRRSNYNSLQVAVVKRYSKGFTITSNYTLSKVEGDFGGADMIPYDQPQDQSLLWGPLDQDHRHRFTTSWVLDLPGGNMAGPLKHVIGGWQWTGVMQFQTGRPFTVESGTDNSGDGIGNDRAKLTGAPVEPPDGSPRTMWFNPAAFAVNDVGTFGNVPKGAYYGPNLQSWDMGLFKNFRISTDMNVQFRAEFFNVFNQVNFDIPNRNRSGGNFGIITRTDPSFGDPRIIQFGLKFVF